jgi:Rrf2 family cysteine metabolism transcriptional repressor
MKVNTKVRYGLRAMLQIAEGYGGDPVPISAIAQSQEISGKYLEQVVGLLRRHDLIASRKGVKGGYVLTRSPAEVSLWDIISALDTHTALVDCVIDPASCERSNACLTRTIWTLLSDKMREFWSAYTLEDLRNKVHEAESHDRASPLDSLLRHPGHSLDD